MKKKNFSKNILPFILCLLIIGALFSIDILTKQWAMTLSSEEPLPIIPNVINGIYVENTGGAWGVLNELPTVVLIMSVICLIIGLIFLFFNAKTKVLNIAILLIIAGAFGNIIDRVRFGHVIDFIQFDFFKWFPVFNFADICVTIGAVILIFYVLFYKGIKEGPVVECDSSKSGENNNVM